MATKISLKSAIVVVAAPKAEEPAKLYVVGFKQLCPDCGWGLTEQRETFASGKPEQLRFDLRGTGPDGRTHTIAAATWESAKGSPELLCGNRMHEAFQMAFSRDFHG